MSETPTTVLITGFEPFEGHRLNVSWEIAQALPPRAADGERWIAECLPCAFGHCLDRLEMLLAQHSPSLVIALGQAEGRAEISIERIAVNLRDARIPDNRGAQPIDQPIVPGAPLAYASTLPYRTLLQELKAIGHPVGLSNTAGTFVCNELFYGLQHRLSGRDIPSGFVHLPLLPEQLPDARRAHDAASRVAREDAPVSADRAPPTIDFAVQRDAIAAMIRLILSGRR
jgi:pyroglutamyl-peptidase